jgi:hypothetical protein
MKLGRMNSGMLHNNVMELSTVVIDISGIVNLTNYLDDLGVDGIIILIEVINE